jgi:hypothetical protein
LEPALAEVIAFEGGNYCYELGKISFYPMTQKVANYIDLKPTRGLWEKVNEHEKGTRVTTQPQAGTCSLVWPHRLHLFITYAHPDTDCIDTLKVLVAEYLTTEVSKRRKRGILGLVGEVSKILFGTSTQADAKEFNSHVTQLEREEQEFYTFLQNK